MEIEKLRKQAERVAASATTDEQRKAALSDRDVYVRQSILAKQVDSVVSIQVARGTNATQAPYQVGLIWGRHPSVELFCGGSLIANDWVVTSAHCIDDTTVPGDIQVYPGLRLSDGSQPLDFVHVYRAGVTAGHSNDIALIQLATPAKGKVPIDLDDRDIEQQLLQQGTQSMIYGWGATKPGSIAISDSLKEGKVYLVPRSVCQQTMMGVTSSMICAGGDQTSDTCTYDSGGPLAAPFQGKTYLIGITVWGDLRGCNQPRTYGVYTKVASHICWIRKKMQMPLPPNCTTSGITTARYK